MSARKNSTSAARASGGIKVTTAPIFHVAMAAMMSSGPLPPRSATRSPGRMPRPANAAAALSVTAESSLKVSDRPLSWWTIAVAPPSPARAGTSHSMLPRSTPSSRRTPGTSR